MDFSQFGIKGTQIANTVTDPYLKLAIVGDVGAGKSWFANSIDGEKFDFDFDGRASSLITHPRAHEITVKTYYDSDGEKAKAMQAFETDLAALKYAKSQGKLPPDFTSIIDSMSFALKAAEDELIRQQGNLSRRLKIGTKTVSIPAGWDVINAMREYLEYCVSELGALGNVICIFHDKDEKDPTTSTVEKQTYTGKITIQPQYLSTMLSIFNDVWYIKINSNGKRLVQTQPEGDFLIGKCTLLGCAATGEVPDISKMLAKHRAELAKKVGNAIVNVTK